MWPADALAADDGGRTVSTAHPSLDVQLPGGGWPLGALIELLQPAPDAPVWPLVLPALAARQHSAGGALALVGSPHEPFVPALMAAGVRADAVLWLRADAPSARLWLAEQALACADVAAVLAWLPQARASDLRRLQLAAARRGDGLLFVLRPAQAARTASPAPLRLRLGVDVVASTLVVHVVKRRGPPLVAPLHLPAQSAAVRALLAAAEQARAAAAARVLPFAPRPDRPDAAREVDHAVDRVAVAA